MTSPPNREDASNLAARLTQALAELERTLAMLEHTEDAATEGGLTATERLRLETHLTALQADIAQLDEALRTLNTPGP